MSDRSRPATGRRAAKRAAWGLATILLAASATPTRAQSSTRTADSPAAIAVRKRLGALINGLPHGVDVGVVVADAADGSAWFTRQADKPLKPASVLKLFVTAAALERFGPDFAFETKLYTRNGELLVLGGGDPGLGDRRIAKRRQRSWLGEFDEWARLLKERGVTTINTIAIDDSIFDRQYRHPDWPDNQAAAWYQAPIGGICFNDNCLEARFKVAGGKVTLATSPELPAKFIRNKLIAARRHKPRATRALGEDVFEFRGSASHDDSFKPVSVGRPAVFFGYALQRALQQRGINTRSLVVRRELTPKILSDAELLDVRATTLSDVLWRTNTFSQNMFAECLLKSLAAYRADGVRSGKPGSWEGGRAVLRSTLAKLGIDLSGAVLRDGSGLSHENRVSADQVVKLLLAMRRHEHAEVFLDSLAEPGKPGSMRKRYNSPVLRGHLRGKTGSISGVRALAGYVKRADGTILAFAVLGNGGPPPALAKQVAEILVSTGASTLP